MSLQLLFAIGRRGPVQIAQLAADVTLYELHERASLITSSPVESGGEIQDHVSREPERVTIEGFVSGSPVELVSLDFSATTRVQEAFDLLEELWNAREPIDVLSGFKLYERMIVERVSVPRDRQAGDSFTFVATLKQVTFAEVADVQIPAETLPPAPGQPSTPQTEEVRAQATSTQDTGQQQTPPAKTTEARASAALQLLRGLESLVTGINQDPAQVPAP